NSAQRKEHWLTRLADSSRLSTQCSYLLCRYKKSRNRYAGSNYYLRTVSGLHFADLSACDGWIKFTQFYSISQYHAVNMLPSVAIMLLTCDRIQNVVCD
ncbi:unnamed protein product, partial [Scytosiphon promiscuus]